VDHPLAEEATYGRRSRKAREQLADALRSYDPAQEQSWEKKYKFFSEGKMKANFRTYAKARHDPFNKDPAWGKSVLSKASNFLKNNNIDPADMFKQVNVDGDETLNRPEIKKALLKALPTLSDEELTAIFDVIDEDRSGEVSLEEFCDAMEQGRNAKISQEATERWRNPIHKIKRLPPARIEGWDHLHDKEAVQGTRYERVGQEGTLGEMCEKESNELIERLSDAFQATPRALQHQLPTPRYLYFGGGADTNRFRKAEYDRALKDFQATGKTMEEFQVSQRSEMPDPGSTELRPGFLCDPKTRNNFAVNGFSALTPRTSARAGPNFQ